MKPVVIEFLMKDSITAGLDKSKMSVEQLLGAARNMKEEASKIGEEGAKSSEYYNSKLGVLRQGVERMSASLKAMGVSEKDTAGVLQKSSEQNVRFMEARVGLMKKMESSLRTALESGNATLVQNTMEELDKEKEYLDAAINAIQKNAELIPKVIKNASPQAPEQQTENMRMQLRMLTNEITNATIKYRDMSEAERNSASGMELKAKLEALVKKAGDLRDAMDDVNRQIRGTASDTKNFDAIAQGLNVVASSAGAATSVFQMFGASQQELIDIQTKLQATLAISNALSVIQNNLQKESALMLGIRTIQENAASTAIAIRTAAEGKGVIVTKLATVAQAAFNLVAKANPYVLLATAVLTVVGALVAFTKGTNEATAAEKRQRVEGERLRKQQEEMSSALGKAAGNVEAKYRSLQHEWKRLKSESEKNKWIQENADKFHELGLNVNSVGDAEQVLVNMAPQVIAALKAVAEAEAYSDLYKQAIKNRAEKWEHRVKSRATGDYYNSVSDADRTQSGLLMPDEWRKAGLDFQKGDYTTEYENDFSSKWKLTKEGEEKLRKYREENALELRRNLEKGYNEEVEFYSKKWEEAEDAAIKAQAKIPPSLIHRGGNDGSNPKGSNDPKKEEDERLKAEQEAAKELQRMRWENEQNAINLLEEGSEKRRRQIQLDYDKEIAAIEEQSVKWREAQNGVLTQDQSDAITAAIKNANDKMNQSLQEMSDEEIAKNKEKLNTLLDQYKDFDQQRRSIDEQYNADMQIYNSELEKLRATGSDTSNIEASIVARTEAYKREIASLQGEILKSSEFYDKLFGEVSEKGYKVLKDFYTQAKETLSKARVLTDGVEIDIPVKDPDGKFVKKTVKVTVDELRRMQKQVDSIRKELEKNNPFAAFRTSWSSLIKEMKNDGDVSGALKKVNADGKALTGTIKGWGESLESVFGERFSKSINEMMSFCDGMMDMGTGIAQIWSGDIVGGITNALSGLGQIVSLFTSWKEKMEEMKRQWYIAEIETNRAIRERSQELAVNRDTIADIIKDQEILNWLVQKGYSRPNSVSVWEAQNEAFQKYLQNIKAEMQANDDLWGRLQGSKGYYEWGNSLNGGSSEWSLRGYSAEQIQLWYNQDKLSDAARDYYEAWVESGKTIDDLKSKIEECYTQMREMVMGVNFDGFLSNVKDALKEARGDIKSFAQFTEDTIAEALLNAFMYQELADMIEPLYNELSESLINGTADKTYLDNWKNRFQDVMSNANSRLDEIAKATGIDVFSGSGSSQSGKAGGFSAMSQEQGTKLEGLFVSGQMHWSNIDEHTEDISVKMSTVSDKLARIEEHTGESKKLLDGIKSSVEKIIREGLKVK